MEIRLNKGHWSTWIESQAPFISADSLKDLSKSLEKEFRETHSRPPNLQIVPPEQISSESLLAYQDQVVGYDLPCLLSVDRPRRGTVMLCAQDPLRSPKSEIGLTVGTFFGLNSSIFRSNRRSHGVMWRVIVKLLSDDYDVWVAVLHINCVSADNGRLDETSINGFTTHDTVKSIDIGGHYGCGINGTEVHCIEQTVSWFLGTRATARDPDGTCGAFKCSEDAAMYLEETFADAGGGGGTNNFAIEANGGTVLKRIGNCRIEFLANL